MYLNYKWWREEKNSSNPSKCFKTIQNTRHCYIDTIVIGIHCWTLVAAVVVVVEKSVFDKKEKCVFKNEKLSNLFRLWKKSLLSRVSWVHFINIAYMFYKRCDVERERKSKQSKKNCCCCCCFFLHLCLYVFDQHYLPRYFVNCISHCFFTIFVSFYICFFFFSRLSLCQCRCRCRCHLKLCFNFFSDYCFFSRQLYVYRCHEYLELNAIL